jgi:Type II restriction endonuclease EcoO109I
MVDLVQIVDELLDDFYRRRIDNVNSLQLKKALARKNPYLYKATGVEKADTIVTEILTAYMSSSDEGIFGDAFFEPLAERIGGGYVANAEGVDVIIEDDKVYKAIAVKSGINVFNAASRKRQSQNFNQLRSRVAKRKKMFDAIVGYGYGKKKTEVGPSGFREVAGQSLWEELTGDPDFYIKIITAMGDKPQQHLAEYQKAFAAAINRFTKEFIEEFCFDDGTINWEKIVRFNSGRVCRKLVVIPMHKTLDKNEELQLEVKAIFSEQESVVNPDDVTYTILPIVPTYSSALSAVDISKIQKSLNDVVEISEDGRVRVKETAEPGGVAIIEVSSSGKTKKVIIKIKKPRVKKI